MTRKVSSRSSVTACPDSDENDDKCSFACISGAMDILNCIIPSWKGTIDDMKNLDSFGEDDNFSNIKKALYKNDRIYYIIATLCLLLIVLFLIGMITKGSDHRSSMYSMPPPFYSYR